jgi:pimeloyl-ACP methyl ester carboxylesterase
MPNFVNDGHSLHYKVHGDGWPVVLLHGITVSFAGNYTAWGWVERLCTMGLQVIGLDFRGHGGSDKPRDPAAYGTEALAGDVIALLDHLGIARASLMGYSLGSKIALHLLHAAPLRFDRSVLIATGDGLIGLPPYTSGEVLPRIAEAVGRPEFPADLPMHVATYWTFATKVGGDRDAAVAAARASYPPCALEMVATIGVPVLVVSGERDPVLGRGPRLAEALPRGRYVEIADADHFQLAGHEDAQRAVAAFLAEAEGSMR